MKSKPDICSIEQQKKYDVEDNDITIDYSIFDEKYNTALQYSQMDRTFNFGIKRSY